MAYLIDTTVYVATRGTAIETFTNGIQEDILTRIAKAVVDMLVDCGYITAGPRS